MDGVGDVSVDIERRIMEGDDGFFIVVRFVSVEF